MRSSIRSVVCSIAVSWSGETLRPFRPSGALHIELAGPRTIDPEESPIHDGRSSIVQLPGVATATCLPLRLNNPPAHAISAKLAARRGSGVLAPRLAEYQTHVDAWGDR